MAIKKSKKPPGSFYIRAGRWWWKATLPGDDKRRTYKLSPHGANTSLKALDGRANEQTAWQIAWKIWERAAVKAKSEISDTLTVVKLIEKFSAHCHQYYHNPNPRKIASHVDTLIRGVSWLISKHKNYSAESITPIEMAKVRDDMLAQENPKLSITTVNKYLRAIKQMYKWGVGEGLVDPYIEAGINRFPLLKPGRTSAVPAKKTLPPPPEDVKAILEYVSPVIRDMIMVQWICDMRPSEIINMQPCFIDRSDDELWIYIPEQHKNAHRGKLRVIPIFPDAREILEPYLNRKKKIAYIFSPKDSADLQRKKRFNSRKTPLSCGNISGSNQTDSPKNTPGEKFTKDAYPRAISRAIKTINKSRRAENILRERQGLEQLRLISHWSPRQLRHAKATENRALAGKAIAAILLGHAPNSQATDAYTWQVIKDEAREKAKQEVREAAKKIIEIQKGSN